MAAQPDQQAVAASLAAYQAQTQALRANLTAFLTRLWASLGTYGSAQVAVFAAQALPVIAGAQQKMAALTAASLAAQKQAMLGGSFAPVAVDPAKVSGAAVRNGTAPAEVYGRPFHLVWRQLADLPHEPGAIEQAIQAGLDRTIDLALTDVQLAKTHTAQQILSGDKHVVGYRRVLEGPYSCGLCVIASTQRYHRQALLAIHPACVVGETQISATKIEAATRRRYTDEVVIISTASGNELTITPNHPVLTDHGWVPAGHLCEGSYIVRSGSADHSLTISPDKDDRPARIGDVWRALAVTGSLGGVPLAAKDFHGDGTDGEVDVVRPDRDLSAVRTATLLKQAHQLGFVDAGRGRVELAREGTSGLLSHAGPASTARSGGPLDVCSALIGGHALHTQLSTVPATPNGVAAGIDMRADRRRCRPVLVRELHAGLTGGIAFDNQIPRQPTGLTARFDPTSAQFSGEGLVVYANQGRRLLNRLAGQVSLDRVVSLRRGYAETRHVFNLQTDEGWYAANGLIVSNCDCSVAPIYGDSDPGQTIDLDAYFAAHEAARQVFGKSSPSGRGVDYRKLLITHAHGELGPVLALRSASFVGPSDLAS